MKQFHQITPREGQYHRSSDYAHGGANRNGPEQPLGAVHVSDVAKVHPAVKLSAFRWKLLIQAMTYKKLDTKLSGKKIIVTTVKTRIAYKASSISHECLLKRRWGYRPFRDPLVGC